MENVRIAIKVKPNSSKNEIVDFSNKVLQLKIAAPPVKGKANKELVTFLSKALRIAKSRIQIVKGEHSRTKIIAVEDLSLEEILRRLGL
jgi:hypothetical protein